MGLSGLCVRAAGPEDAPAIAAVIGNAFAYLAVDPPPSALRETSDSVARWLASGGGTVAEAEGEIVGVILWEVCERSLYLGRLAVLKAWRRRGIARMLVREGEAEAGRRGIRRIELGTRLALADNRRLFASCGFRETTRHRHPGFLEDTWVTLERILE
jgi:predicted N-acetyltransferase YhbS